MPSAAPSAAVAGPPPPPLSPGEPATPASPDPPPESPAVEAALEALRDDELEQFLAAEEATAAAAKSAAKDQWKAYVLRERPLC